MGAEEVHVRLEGVDSQRLHRLRGLGGRPEAAQTGEGGERADQFGLVVRVLVRTVRSVDRYAPGFLVRVPLARLLQVRVDLYGEGGSGGEQLQEEGEAGAEPGDGVRAQFALRVGFDGLGERDLRLAGGGGGAGEARGGSGVGAHPHLGLRFAGGRDAEQGGDGRGGSPGVGAHGVGQPVHGVVLGWCGAGG